MKGLSRDEAVGIIQRYLKSLGLESPGLNKNNLGGAAIGQYQIYFDYEPSKQRLKCSALIYKFHDDPGPGVIEGFKSAELEETAGAGGRMVDYEPENKGLYLSRWYADIVSDEAFAEDLMSLMQASEIYGDRVLERVASSH